MSKSRIALIVIACAVGLPLTASAQTISNKDISVDAAVTKIGVRIVNQTPEPRYVLVCFPVVIALAAHGLMPRKSAQA